MCVKSGTMKHCIIESGTKWSVLSEVSCLKAVAVVVSCENVISKTVWYSVLPFLLEI